MVSFVAPQLCAQPQKYTLDLATQLTHQPLSPNKSKPMSPDNTNKRQPNDPRTHEERHHEEDSQKNFPPCGYGRVWGEDDDAKTLVPVGIEPG
jgi:hypothetical protein